MSKINSFIVHSIDIDGTMFEIKTPMVYDPESLLKAAQIIALKENYFKDDNLY